MNETMAMNARDVVITGIGLVSCLGEGIEAHREAMASPPEPRLETDRFPPFSVHPLPEIDWSRQIPKRGDQRQMETWQRLGVYAAGMALDDAGMKGDAALCSNMDMIVAAAGGERDIEVDTAVLQFASRPDAAVLANEKLINDLRPTLFLAQLSNLLAGNISIVHGVTGSSRTFMGEEGAGLSALQTAVARLKAGQSTHALVGAAVNAQHPDSLMCYELGAYLHRGAWAPIWSRESSAGGGVLPGSGAAFLVLETREHAQVRGRAPYAEVSGVVTDRLRRDAQFAERLRDMFDSAGVADGLVLSGASGAKAATAAERTALEGRPVRAFSSLTGHLREVQLFFGVALAALAVSDGKAPPPFHSAEGSVEMPLDSALVTIVGFHRGEGAATISRVER